MILCAYTILNNNSVYQSLSGLSWSGVLASSDTSMLEKDFW